jgi:hypothetical protein
MFAKRMLRNMPLEVDSATAIPMLMFGPCILITLRSVVSVAGFRVRWIQFTIRVMLIFMDMNVVRTVNSDYGGSAKFELNYIVTVFCL